MAGYAGKILRLNLTTGVISTLDTSKYEQFGGGHGFGSAVFWDLCEDFTVDGLDPKNVCTVMPGSLAGSIIPGTSRTEVNAIGTAGFPTYDAKTMANNNWYNRSNFGGHFAAVLKQAGWDGIAIEGRASSPVWVKIMDDRVTLEDAGPEGDSLWGLDTWTTQEEIFRLMADGQRYLDGNWQRLPGTVTGGEWTTRRPEVLAIGPAGEAQCRQAALIHQGGRGAGDAGMGGVWGSKNLKAIGVIGTGVLEVADPQGLLETRLWHWKNWGYDVDNPGIPGGGRQTTTSAPEMRPGYGASTGIEPNRWGACQSCIVPCARRMQSGVYNDTQCSDSMGGANTTRISQQITQLNQMYGFNARIFKRTRTYVRDLEALGILGPGKEIDSGDLQLDHYRSFGWMKSLMEFVTGRETELADDLAQGPIRYAAKLGRLEEDLESGLLKFPQQTNLNSEQHWTFMGGEWAYGCLVGERDVNEHDFTFQLRVVAPFTPYGYGGMSSNDITVDRFVNHVTDNMVPYEGDPFMLDYGEGETGIYSRSKAKQVAWHRHYTRGWKQSMGFCDWWLPQWFNTNAENFEGPTPVLEPRYYNNVFGGNFTYADGVEMGRRIWNLDRAIWVLQGRHRDLEKFSGYVHGTVGVPRSIPIWFPVYKDGQWHQWGSAQFREAGNWGPDGKSVFERTGVEEWKTHFYDLEGWDTTTGYPSRATLEGLNLGYVADKLEAAGKLGATGTYKTA